MDGFEEKGVSPHLLLAVESVLNETEKKDDGTPGTSSLNVKTNESEDAPKEGTTQDANGEKIRRPPNAFFLFAKENRRKISALRPNMRNSEISTKLGEIWQQLPKSSKDKFQEQARALEIQHRLKYPDYMYKPGPKEKKKRGRKKKIATKSKSIAGDKMAKQQFPQQFLVANPMAQMAMYPQPMAFMGNQMHMSAHPYMMGPTAVYMSQPAQQGTMPSVCNQQSAAKHTQQNSSEHNDENPMERPPSNVMPTLQYMASAARPPFRQPSCFEDESNSDGRHDQSSINCPNCAFPLKRFLESNHWKDHNNDPREPIEIKMKVIAPTKKEPNITNNDTAFEEAEADEEMITEQSYPISANKEMADLKTPPPKRGRGRPPRKAAMPKITMAPTSIRQHVKNKAIRHLKERSASKSPRSPRIFEDEQVDTQSVGKMIGSLTRSVQENMSPLEEGQVLSDTLQCDNGDIAKVVSQKTKNGVQTVIQHFKRSPSLSDLMAGGDNPTTPRKGGVMKSPIGRDDEERDEAAAHPTFYQDYNNSQQQQVMTNTTQPEPLNYSCKTMTPSGHGCSQMTQMMHSHGAHAGTGGSSMSLTGPYNMNGMGGMFVPVMCPPGGAAAAGQVSAQHGTGAGAAAYMIPTPANYPYQQAENSSVLHQAQMPRMVHQPSQPITTPYVMHWPS